MRTLFVAMIVLAVAGSVIPAQAGWWSGSPANLGTDAFPVNQLRLVPRYRDTFDPLVFNIATKVDREGNPLSIVTAFFEENLTIIKDQRALMATCQAKIMMGEGGLGELYASYNGGLIRVVVEPDNGWEEGTEWLSQAIYEAQVQGGMRADLHKVDPRFRAQLRASDKAERIRRGEDPNSCDPGIFPPFITVPAEAKPQVLPDGTIRLRCPQMSANIKIVVPITNILDGEGCYVSLFVKHQKGKGKLWEQTSASFVASHKARVTIPNPARRAPAPEPPQFRERVESVRPPEPPEVRPTATGQCPEPVSRVIYGEHRMPSAIDWTSRDQFSAFWPLAETGQAGFFTFLARNDQTLIYEGDVVVTDQRGETLMSISVQSNQNRGGVVYHTCPPNTTLKAHFVVRGQTLATATFETGQPGIVSYVPMFEGER